MTSSTSVMSTSGVTLMPVMRSSSDCAVAAMAAVPFGSGSRAIARDGQLGGGVALGLEQREHLFAEGVGAREAGFDDALEEVVEGDGRQRDQDADSGRHQRL